MAWRRASEVLRRSGAGLVLLALAIACVLPPVLAGRLYAPGDGLAYYFPIRALAFEAVRQGELPFWNPYFFSGTPLLAGIQPGVFFPGNWSFLVLPPVWAWHVTLVLAIFVAGAGAYAFMRALALPRMAALVTGVSFMLSGYMAHYVVFLTMLQTAGLLGFLLWAIERHARTREARYAIAGAGVTALMILAGHPQTAAYSMIVAGAYALYRMAAVPGGERVAYLARLAAMGVTGIGLAALQLAPTLELIQASQRQAIPYARLILSSLPPQGLPTLLFPFLYGANDPSVFLSVPRWGSHEWLRGVEGYAGAAAWALAAVAVAGALKNGLARFWVAIASVSVLLAMGGHTPLYKLWAQLPVVKMMPFASRHLLEFAFALAVLAGLGMAALQRQEADRRQVGLAAALLAVPLGAVSLGLMLFGPAVAARTQPYLQAQVDLSWALSLANPALWLPILLVTATLAAATLGRRGPTWLWTSAVVGLLAVDLLLVAHHLGRYAESPRVPAGQSVTTTPDRSAGRVFSVARWTYPYNGGSYDYLAALHYPAVNVLQEVPSVSGFDAFILKRYGDTLTMPSDGFMRDAAVLHAPGHHVVDVLGLKTLLLDPKQPEPPASSRWVPAGTTPAGMKRYTNPQALPYAWRASTVTTLEAEAVERRMRSPAFDPRREALVETDVAPITPGTATARPTSLNRLTVETDGVGPGLVVVSEGYDPGWRAVAGDRELRVHRVDSLILGVEVPAGRQVVELTYAPRAWPVGLATSGLSGLLLLGWFGWDRRRKRKGAP